MRPRPAVGRTATPGARRSQRQVRQQRAGPGGPDQLEQDQEVVGAVAQVGFEAAELGGRPGPASRGARCPVGSRPRARRPAAASAPGRAAASGWSAGSTTWMCSRTSGSRSRSVCTARGWPSYSSPTTTSSCCSRNAGTACSTSISVASTRTSGWDAGQRRARRAPRCAGTRTGTPPPGPARPPGRPRRRPARPRPPPSRPAGWSRAGPGPARPRSTGRCARPVPATPFPPPVPARRAAARWRWGCSRGRGRRRARCRGRAPRAATGAGADPSSVQFSYTNARARTRDGREQFRPVTIESCGTTLLSALRRRLRGDGHLRQARLRRRGRRRRAAARPVRPRRRAAAGRRRRPRRAARAVPPDRADRAGHGRCSATPPSPACTSPR